MYLLLSRAEKMSSERGGACAQVRLSRKDSFGCLEKFLSGTDKRSTGVRVESVSEYWSARNLTSFRSSRGFDPCFDSLSDPHPIIQLAVIMVTSG